MCFAWSFVNDTEIILQVSSTLVFNKGAKYAKCNIFIARL